MIEQAVEVLKRGGVILYPTDTVWGLGCDATNASAIDKLVKLKRSEGKIGHIVLMGDADMAARYVNDAPSVAWELMELSTKPLTLILPGGVGIDKSLLGRSPSGCPTMSFAGSCCANSAGLSSRPRPIFRARIRL